MERTFSMAELVLHYMLAQGALIIKNHSMTEVGRDIWRSFGPTPQLRQRHPDQGVQGHVQVALGSSRRRPCSLSGQPVPVPLYKWVKNSKKQEKYVISHSVPGMPSILSKKKVHVQACNEKNVSPILESSSCMCVVFIICGEGFDSLF